jgi:lipoprotein-anchoring transpeptidase ErfK/SrfK
MMTLAGSTMRMKGILAMAAIAALAGSSFGQTRRHYQLQEPQPGPALRRVNPPAAPAHPAARTSTAIIPAPPPPPAPAPAAPAAASVTPPPAAPAAVSSGGPVLPDYPKRPVANVSIPKQTRVNLAWQVALESADFSPGILDGHFKRKSTMALSEFAARYFPGATPFDLRVFNALKVDPDDVVTTYTITDDDAAQVGGPLPEDWNGKARLDRLRYESLVDCIAEKFHCSRVLLETMNPGVKMGSLEPGQTLNVPNLRPFPTDNKPTVVKRYVEGSFVSVNLAEKAIRIFDRENRELALFHCSVAKDKAKLPTRDTVVKAIAAPNPNYTFDPRNWPEVSNVSQVLTIPPGPRNPVGLAWVSLDLPGYGIHGTPKPELIGKTGSHGCFRLTNWDALKFAGMVKEGMLVRIENPEKGE